MSHERLKNQAAMAVAFDVVRVFAPLLREEECKDALSEVFDRVKNGIEWYCLEVEHIREAA